MTTVVNHQTRQEHHLHQIFSKFLEASCELIREDPIMRVNPLWQSFQTLLAEKPLDYPQIYAFLAKMTKDQQTNQGMQNRSANNVLGKMAPGIQHSHSLNVPTITRQPDLEDLRRYSPDQNNIRFQPIKGNMVPQYESIPQSKSKNNFIEVPPIQHTVFERSPSSTALLTRSHSSMFPLNNSGFSPRGFGSGGQQILPTTNSINNALSSSVQPQPYSSDNSKGVLVVEKPQNLLRKKLSEGQFSKYTNQLKNMGCVCDILGDELSVQGPLKKLYRLVGLNYFKNLINDSFTYGKNQAGAEKLISIYETYSSNRQALGNLLEPFNFCFNQIIQLRKKTAINAQRLTRAFLFLIENERGFIEAVSTITKLILQSSLERGEPSSIYTLFPDPLQRMRLFKILENDFETPGEEIFLLIAAVLATPVNLFSFSDSKCDTRRFNLVNIPSFNQIYILQLNRNFQSPEYYLLIEDQDADDFELFRNLNRQEHGLESSGEKDHIYSKPIILSASEETEASRRKSNIDPPGSGFTANNFSYLSTNQHPMSFVTNFELERSPGYSNSKQEQMKVFEPIVNSSRRYEEDDWNRVLLLSKTRDLLQNLNADSERLNSVARFGALTTPSSKENHQPRSPLKFMSIFKNELQGDHQATGPRALFANKGYEFVPFHQGGLI